jgi:glycerol 2-dehydrogenase (NADP+)
MYHLWSSTVEPRFQSSVGVCIDTRHRGLHRLAGFGTWAGVTVQEREAATSWILTALKVMINHLIIYCRDWSVFKAGYRHIDTAHLYGSEYAVGEAIRQSGIPREQFFVTTKLPWNHQGRVKESLDESLKNAGLDYYDLVYFIFAPRLCLIVDNWPQYLIHWPQVLAYEGTFMFVLFATYI